MMDGSCSDFETRRLERVAQSFTSYYWRWEITEDGGLPIKIEEELSRRLAHIDPCSWPERFGLGGVFLAGRTAHLGQLIQGPCRLEYYEPKVALEIVSESYPEFLAESVIYRDHDMAVVVKPAGLPSTAPRDQTRYHLQAQLERYFGQPVHLPSRLDTGVVGVLIASLSARMNRYLQRAYDARRIEKYYLCEVLGAPTWTEKVCEAPIERDPRHPVLRRCAEAGRSAESAMTRLRCVATNKVDGADTALLQAEPVTGRTHQIRLHCQYEGLPILGDPYYSESSNTDTLRLISYAIRMHHPFRGELMTWQVPSNRLPLWLQEGPPFEIYYRVK